MTLLIITLHYYLIAVKLVSILIFFILFLNLFFNSYKEIRNKTYFKYYRNFYCNSELIWELDVVEYDLMSFIFDFFTIITNPFKFIFPNTMFIIVFFILFIFFSFIPILFVVLLQLNLIAYIIIISYNKITKKSVTLTGKSPCLDKLFYNLFYIPRSWAYIIIYYSLKIKKKTISIKQLELIFFTIIFHKPLWYFRLMVYWTQAFFSIFSSDIWSRKSVLIWPVIFYNFIYGELFNSVLRSYSIITPLLFGRRIIIVSGIISLNPVSGPLHEFISEHGVLCLNRFSCLKIVYFHDQPHQVFCRNDNDLHGFIMTSTKSLILRDQLIPANILSPDNTKQRYVYTAFGNSLVDNVRKYNSNFFTNMKLHNYENYVGNSLRLGLYSHLDQTNLLIVQNKHRAEVTQLLNKFSYAQVYFGSFGPHHKSYLNFYKNQQDQLKGLIEVNDTLKEELTKQSNKELFDCLVTVHNGGMSDELNREVARLLNDHNHLPKRDTNFWT